MILIIVIIGMGVICYIEPKSTQENLQSYINKENKALKSLKKGNVE